MDFEQVVMDFEQVVNIWYKCESVELDVYLVWTCYILMTFIYIYIYISSVNDVGF